MLYEILYIICIHSFDMATIPLRQQYLRIENNEGRIITFVFINKIKFLNYYVYTYVDVKPAVP